MPRRLFPRRCLIADSPKMELQNKPEFLLRRGNDQADIDR
jgi:hypothetical protein